MRHARTHVLAKATLPLTLGSLDFAQLARETRPARRQLSAGKPWAELTGWSCSALLWRCKQRRPIGLASLGCGRTSTASRDADNEAHECCGAAW